MILIRKSVDRGHRNFGWLDARHSFSFGDYRDPEHMGFRGLRVLNEDVIAPGAGFAPHGHREMEIITYVISGALEHRDSTGGGGLVRPGEVQYMRAGTGVTHSEKNASATTPLHLVQIWLLPTATGLAPGYAQKAFGEERRGRLRLVAAGDGRNGALAINQSADVYAGLFGEGAEIAHRFAEGRHGYLQILRGGVELGGLLLQAGDGAKISDEKEFSARALADETELLLFDLA